MGKRTVRMKYPKRSTMVKASDRTAREEQVIELKCFLRKPMEANLQVLIDEFNKMCVGEPEENKVVEQEPVIEKAQSLEDWFNEFI